MTSSAAEKDPTSAVLEVVAQVVAAIRDGQLAPGQRLVETDFAKRLGVARTTVREAFQRLEAEGLLAVERHRGFTVRTLTRSMVRDIYQAREALDGLAARLSAPHFSAHGRELRDIQDRLQKAHELANMQAFTQANKEFHDLIRLRSGNEIIIKLLSNLEHSVYHYQYRLLVRGNAAIESQDDHLQICDALLKGDGATAEKAMRKHVQRSLKELMQLPDGFFGGSNSG